MQYSYKFFIFFLLKFFDGSVDRTQKHNVFAMAHVIKKDGTSETVCLGFDIPKTKGALGYLICLMKVVSKFLPWDVFFSLVTSLH